MNSAFAMKFNITALLLSSALGLSAQDVPSFLAGFQYKIESANSSDGIPFDYFAIEESDYRNFKKSIRGKRKHKRFWLEKHFLRVTHCEVDGWVVMTFKGFDFEEISVFKED